MLKRMFIITTLILFLLTLTSCSLTAQDLHEVSHRVDVPPNMLFLGDSIPAGYGLEGYSSDNLYNCRSYPNILAEKYNNELKNECGNAMINKAVSGETSSELLDLIKTGKLDGDLAKCDAVVISIGGNDLLGLIFDLFNKLGYSPDKNNFNYKNIDFLGAADALTSINSDADKALDNFEKILPVLMMEIDNRTNGVIYIQTLYDPLEYYSNIPKISDFSAKKIGRLNDIIKKNSEGKYCVIDIASTFSGQAEIVTNIKDFDIHPNYLGHQLIADEIDSEFRKTTFTYTTEEFGEKYLTKEGYLLIAGGVLLSILALTVPAILVGKSTKKKSSSIKQENNQF